MSSVFFATSNSSLLTMCSKQANITKIAICANIAINDMLMCGIQQGFREIYLEKQTKGRWKKVSEKLLSIIINVPTERRGRRAKPQSYYINRIRMSVCLFVCLFVCPLPISSVGFRSGGLAICQKGRDIMPIQGETIKIFIRPTVRTILSGNRTLVEENRPKRAYFYRFLERMTHFLIQYSFTFLNEDRW